MAEQLDSRRIFITGAASGMGRAITELFAANGAKLALLDRNADGVKAAAEAAGAQAYGCDVSDRAQVNEVVAKASSALGGLDGWSTPLASSTSRRSQNWPPPASTG